jgi:polysaccharide export outer membrane protein
MRVLLSLLAFCAFLSGAAANAEALHPGDTIHISVWQDPKLDQTVVVGPDGMISFPLAGHIRAGGMTPQALEDALRNRLKKNYTGQLDITVSLAAVNKDEEDLSKPRFYVTGEVARPGPYVLKPGTNIVQAIALAGGVGPFAAIRRIQVHRQLKGVDSIYLFNYNAYQSGTDSAENINLNLRSGDVVIVPERGLFE